MKNVMCGVCREKLLLTVTLIHFRSHYNTIAVQSNLAMAMSMKENMSRINGRDKGGMNGRMDVFMRDPFWKICEMD